MCPGGGSLLSRLRALTGGATGCSVASADGHSDGESTGKVSATGAGMLANCVPGQAAHRDVAAFVRGHRDPREIFPLRERTV